MQRNWKIPNYHQQEQISIHLELLRLLSFRRELIQAGNRQLPLQWQVMGGSVLQNPRLQLSMLCFLHPPYREIVITLNAIIPTSIGTRGLSLSLSIRLFDKNN